MLREGSPYPICHASCVMCHVYFFLSFLFFKKMVKLVGELTANLPISSNLQPICLFLQIYSQFASFFKCTVKCLLHINFMWLSNIRKEKCCCSSCSVTIKGTPHDSEMGCSGDFWSNCVFLILQY